MTAEVFNVYNTVASPVKRLNFRVLYCGQLEFKENGNGSGNEKQEQELVKIVIMHRILY